MSEYIDTVFGPKGILARRFDGYAPRSGQIEMARAVDAALSEGRHLLAEAPTGTGKGVAYGVPATYHAVHNNRRVLMATANIALQEQLVEKDLPQLAEILPWDFKFALLKGKSNYLCHDKRYEEEAKGTLRLLDNPDDAEQLDALIAWAQSTDTGDVSELPFKPEFRLWRRFSTTSDDCKGTDCPFRDECCAAKAKAKAQDAHVVVSNYHLLFAHLQVKEATGEDLVLPPFDVAVLDEAHKAADIARDFFGFRVTQGSIRWAARLLKKLGENSLLKRINIESDAFFNRLIKHRRSSSYKVRLRSPNVLEWERLSELLAALATTYIRAAVGISDEEFEKELSRVAARASGISAQIRSAMTLADQNSVVFIEEDMRGSAVLRSKPIDVAERLKTGLFDATHCVVLTSATLTTGGSFEHVGAEVGVPNPKILSVDSPFDYSSNALLVVPQDMPAPTDLSYPIAVANTVAEVVELARGRTLALFTSYRNLNAAYDALAGSKRRILRQGDMPRTALVKAFREDKDSVLLGTESFWAGVDVPGEALSCVVIDRLPFPSPEDPILDAISERDRQWFRHYSLPRAVIAFKQGFGRLIRSASDRGVVVVLDHRLVTKPYGSVFIHSLPNVLKSRRLENVRTFLDEEGS